MASSVKDIHHGYRQGVGVDSTNVPVEGQPCLHCRSLGYRQRRPENRIGAEIALVGRTVELQHNAVYQILIEYRETYNLSRNL